MNIMIESLLLIFIVFVVVGFGLFGIYLLGSPADMNNNKIGFVMLVFVWLILILLLLI